jgi:hypothetical protein
MERDEADFRLFHNRSELVRWEAEERSSQPESLRLLTVADFPEKPSFDFNFLLKQGGLLVFDLAAQGFSVPVSESPEKFFLLLPSSAENGQSVEGVDYNTGVRKGNNRVAVPAEDILKGPVEKKFAWDWKNEQWLLRQDRTLHILNQHTVKLTVIVRPHHETGLGPALAFRFLDGAGSSPGVESIVEPADFLPADVGVNLGRRDLAVAEHHLDRPQVGPPLQKMGGERMTKDMGRDLGQQPGPG